MMIRVKVEYNFYFFDKHSYETTHVFFSAASARPLAATSIIIISSFASHAVKASKHCIITIRYFFFLKSDNFANFLEVFAAHRYI